MISYEMRLKTSEKNAKNVGNLSRMILAFRYAMLAITGNIDVEIMETDAGPS